MLAVGGGGLASKTDRELGELRLFAMPISYGTPVLLELLSVAKPVNAVRWCTLDAKLQKLMLAVACGSDDDTGEAFPGEVRLYEVVQLRQGDVYRSTPSAADSSLMQLRHLIPCAYVPFCLAFSHTEPVEERLLIVGLSSRQVEMHKMDFRSPDRSAGGGGGGGPGGQGSPRQRVEVEQDIYKVSLRSKHGSSRQRHAGGEVHVVCFSEDAATFAVGGQFDAVVLHNATTGKAKQHAETGRSLELPYGAWVYAGSFAPDGKFACGGYDNNVKIFDVRTGECLRKLRCEDVVRELCFSPPHGQLLVIGGKDKKVTIFEAATGQLLRSIDKEEEVRAISISPHGQLLASGGGDRSVEIHLLRADDGVHRIDVADDASHANVHERGLSISRRGNWVAVLYGGNKAPRDHRTKLVVYRLGVPSREGPERAAPIWETIYDDGDDVSGVCFAPSDRDMPEPHEQATPLRLLVSSQRRQDGLRVYTLPATAALEPPSLPTPALPTPETVIAEGIEAFCFARPPPRVGPRLGGGTAHQPEWPPFLHTLLVCYGVERGAFAFHLDTREICAIHLLREPEGGVEMGHAHDEGRVQGEGEGAAATTSRVPETPAGKKSARFAKKAKKDEALNVVCLGVAYRSRGASEADSRGLECGDAVDAHDAADAANAADYSLLLAVSEYERGELNWWRCDCVWDLRPSQARSGKARTAGADWVQVHSVKDGKWREGAHESKAFKCPAVDFTRDGQYLAIGWSDCKVRLFDALRGSELMHFDEGYLPRSVCFLQGEDIVDPPLLASGGRNGQITLRDVTTGATVKQSEFGPWVSALCTSGSGALLALGTIGSGAKVMDTLLDPLSERVVAFWAEGSGLPISKKWAVRKPGTSRSFLTQEVLVHQTSPSGRSLVAHAAKQGAIKRLKLLLQLQPKHGPLLFSTLLRRDMEGKHALDHALRNKNYLATKLLLEAVAQLPPRARFGLTEPYHSVVKPAYAKRCSMPRQIVRKLPGGPGHSFDGGALTMAFSGPVDMALQAGGSADIGAANESYNFLTELALVFPALCAAFLRQIDLDEYEVYAGSPGDLRLPETLLAQSLEDPRGVKEQVALQGKETFAPLASELWETPHAPSSAGFEVDVECRMVGLPGLSGADGNETFSRLVRTFFSWGTHVFEEGAMTTPAMQAVIEYKWSTFAERRWRLELVMYAAFAALYCAGVYLLWDSAPMPLGGESGGESDGNDDVGGDGDDLGRTALLAEQRRMWHGMLLLVCATAVLVFLLLRHRRLIVRMIHDPSRRSFVPTLVLDTLSLVTIVVIIVSHGPARQGVLLLASGHIPDAMLAGWNPSWLDHAGVAARSVELADRRLANDGGSALPELATAAAAASSSLQRQLRSVGGGLTDDVELGEAASAEAASGVGQTIFSLACCFGSLLLFHRFTYLMRGIKRASSLILLLKGVLVDIAPFTFVTAFFLLACGYALALLEPRGSGPLSSGLNDFLVGVYMPLLGEFEKADAVSAAWLAVFTLYSFLSNIVLLNALIAIISHSHAASTLHAAEQRSLQLAQVVIEMQEQIHQSATHDEIFPRWVHVLRRVDPKRHVRLNVGGGAEGYGGVNGIGGSGGGTADDDDDDNEPSVSPLGVRGSRAPMDDGGFLDASREASSKVRAELREIKAKLAIVSENVLSQLRNRSSAVSSMESSADGSDHNAHSGRARAAPKQSHPCGMDTGAIALDMGTGEMKLLALLYRGGGRGEVVVRELASTSEIQKQHSTTEIALSFADRVRNRSRSSVNSVGSTEDDGSAHGTASDVDVYARVVECFKEGLNQLRPDKQQNNTDLFFEQQIVWDSGVIGATAWFRKLHRDGQEGVMAFLREIKDVIETHAHTLGVILDLQIEVISGENEAMYEQRAVEHACVRAELPLPTAILSGGSGSMQFSSSQMRLVASIPTATAMGVDLLKARNPEAWRQKVLHAFEACGALQEKYVSYGPVRHAASALRRHHGGGGTRGPVGALSPDLHLVGISGLFYAAKAARLPQLSYLPMHQALEALGKLEAECVEPDQQPDNRKLRDAANAMRITVILKSFLKLAGVHEYNAKIMFARDWTLPPFRKEEPFRTTWTAGWWIERLRARGVLVAPFAGSRQGQPRAPPIPPTTA